MRRWRRGLGAPTAEDEQVSRSESAPKDGAATHANELLDSTALSLRRNTDDVEREDARRSAFGRLRRSARLRFGARAEVCDDAPFPDTLDICVGDEPDQTNVSLARGVMKERPSRNAPRKLILNHVALPSQSLHQPRQLARGQIGRERLDDGREQPQSRLLARTRLVRLRLSQQRDRPER